MILAAGSLALCLVATARQPIASFYLLPTRAWEILIGSLLAFAQMPKPRTRAQAQWEQILGLLCILVPVFAYQSTTPFPGLAATAPFSR